MQIDLDLSKAFFNHRASSLFRELGRMGLRHTSAQNWVRRAKILA